MSGKKFNFTLRQKTAADCLCQGMTRKEIADKMKISLSTVDIHLNSVRRKCGVHTNLRAVVAILG